MGVHTLLYRHENFCSGVAWQALNTIYSHIHLLQNPKPNQTIERYGVWGVGSWVVGTWAVAYHIHLLQNPKPNQTIER